MPIFDGNLPYTNLHELNNDWIVKTVKEVKDKTEDIEENVRITQENASQTAEDRQAVAELKGQTQTLYDDTLIAKQDVENSLDPLTEQINLNKTNINIQTSRIDEIVSTGTVNPNAELLDIRVRADGTTYPTAGDSVRGQISPLNAISFDTLTNDVLPTPQEAWIRASNGELVLSSATYMFVFSNILPKYIKAFLASNTNVVCGIAFYNTDTISTAGYMSAESVPFASGSHESGLWYNVEVPDNCKCVAITTMKPSQTVAQYQIMFDRITISALNTGYSYFPLDSGYINGWIRHSNGELVDSTATKSFKFTDSSIKKLAVYTESNTSVINLLSCYSGENIDTNDYMLAESIPWNSSSPGTLYNVVIPNNVRTFVITVRISGNPYIKVLTDDVLYIADERYTDEEEVKKLIPNDTVLYGNWNTIYHWGMSGVAERTAPVDIPSQSVFDVRNAYNNNFKCIELNVHKTYDDKYVVTHGLNGALGHDFNDLDGNDAYGTVISQKTLAELQGNYRYRCTNPDFRTSISTLEEILKECKKYCLIPMVQYVDANEIEIIKGIMGKDFFMYGAPRSVYDGPIVEYFSYPTKQQILDRCHAVGKPYIYSFGNLPSFTDDERQDIINTLHQEGFYTASAYMNINSFNKYTAMGLDFVSVDKYDSPHNVILEGKLLTFNADGTVTWTDASLM